MRDGRTRGESMRKLNLLGRRYNRLVVTREAGRYRKNSACQVLWECVCDCGKTKVCTGNKLRTGHVQSCGCLEKSLAKRFGDRFRTHGEGHKSDGEYKAWLEMKRRCLRPTCKVYFRYGGRGIRVAQVWQYSYETFLADMGRKPSPTHSLDRINNDGNYEPGNCRWATKKQQANNRHQGNRYVRYHSKTVQRDSLPRKDPAR